MASRLSSETNTDIDDNMDKYVEGVYAKRLITQDGQDTYTFVEAVECDKVFKGVVMADIEDTLKEYKCPNLSDDTFTL